MLQLADRSLVHPKGVPFDVLVKVQGFIIPFDLVVLDFEEDQDITILLGRPFHATSKQTIDLERNELIMKIDGKIEVSKCGQDSQNEGSVREECYALFYLILNFLDQRNASSCASATKRNVRERDKCRDFGRKMSYQKIQDG